MSEGKGVPHRTRVRDVEDEGTEVEHLLAEPRNDHVSVDDFFRVDNKTQDVNISGCESCTREGGENTQKVQGKLSDIGLDDERNALIGPSTACEDYLLDTEFVDKASDCEDFPREGLSFEKSSPETHSSGYSGSESSAIGASESTSTSIGKSRNRNGYNDHKALCELHSVSQRKCGCPNQKKENTEKKSPILYTSQNRKKLQSRLGFLSCSGTSDTDFTSFSDLHRTSEEASLISNPRKRKQFLSAGPSIERINESEQGEPVKGSAESSMHRRSRKPPVRYIDEFSGSMSLLEEKRSTSGTARNRMLNVRTSSENDNRHGVFRSFKLARQGFYGRSPNKSSDTIRNICGQSKEFSPVTRLDSDEETDSDEPEKVSPARKGSKICGDRRKHQMIWTLPEVERLVDGISHYGVGRWTEIQRHFFPTSTYRTPVDLRDKWRNLLKASNAWIQNDQEEQDEESQKNGHRQLPKEILHRISELGRLYPYPVKRTPNHTPSPTPKRSSRK
uniref:Uncharacterized protein n=1 Tax=Kalanchoe fedtschenkoi TaxID=63787 RepID=A0A7N0UTX2_KALFE